MPAMPRYSKRAMAIAYNILGKPANMQKRTKAQKELDAKITALEIVRIK